MPSRQVLESLQELYLADDVNIPDEAASWTAEEAERFFESGGLVRPRPLSARTPGTSVVDVSDQSADTEDDFMRKRRILAKAAGLSLADPAESEPATATATAPVSRPGVYRWLVDISTWEPKNPEWKMLLAGLPPEDAEKVMKFRFVADQKRALVSRYLVRRACFEATGVPFDRVRVERTKGGKPFMANKPRGSANFAGLHANWNFNVSHEGKYVVLAAEPVMVCGVDVAAPEEQRAGAKARPITEHLDLMKSQLTQGEWAVIQRARPDERTMEDAFRKFWSLKEAYTKGRGDGLGFEFNRADFTLSPDTKPGLAGNPVGSATVVVDGRRMPEWGFFLQALEADHWISVARGPPTDIVDAFGKFKATFGELRLSQSAIAEELAMAEPPFQTKTIDDLVADEKREKLAEARS
jgi:4'-phosphopantetheinyl transferase